MGLLYDWCYQDLDEPTRRQIRETLVKRTSAMFEAAASGKAWWHRAYMQNHLWVNVSGMAVVGLALFDEVDDAVCWVGLPLEKFRRTMAALGPDGASHEGVGYWEYGVEYMLKFMDLARTYLDVDLYDSPWWRNTALYAQHLSLPRNAWKPGNCIVDLADCPRGHWYGPEYLLRGLARRFQDGHAQWLAQQIDEAHVAARAASWLNLVCFHATLHAKPPDDLPTLHHFQDMGIVAARTGWSGDESLPVFKCGPFLGHEAMDRFAYDPGGGHVHPDANHFVVFGGGQWLLRADEILLDKELSLELRFHPEQLAERQGNVFLATGKHVVLRIEPLTTVGVEVSGEALPLPGRHSGKQSSLLAVCLRTQRANWRNALALSWSEAGEKPTQISLQTEGRSWTFGVRDRKLVLDWETGHIE